MAYIKFGDPYMICQTAKLNDCCQMFWLCSTTMQPWNWTFSSKLLLSSTTANLSTSNNSSIQCMLEVTHCKSFTPFGILLWTNTHPSNWNIYFNPAAYTQVKTEYRGDFLIPQHNLYLVCKARIFRAFSKYTPLVTLSFTQLSLCI